MKTQDIEKLGIGKKEKATLSQSKIKIVSVVIKSKTKDGKEMTTPLAELMCKHPDREELISISKVKIERNGKLEVVSTWVQTNEEDGIQKIVKSSALALLMVYLKCNSIEELYGKEVEAIKSSEENHYLCIKAY